MPIVLLLILLCVLPSGHVWAIAVQQDDGDTVTPAADVTVTSSATLVWAADANRATLNCTNNSASVNVRWGNSAVTAASGQRIPFGTAIEIRNKAAIYMISEGANVTVSCTEEVQ